MTDAERELIRIGKEFAEICADCEELRRNEPYPQDKWRAAWWKRMELMSAMINATKKLTERETEPQS